MKTIEEIRRENLRQLRERVTARLLAEKLQISESQISQWVNGSINSGTNKPRNMRSSTARRIEACCALEKGWLDVDRSQTVAQPYDEKSGNGQHVTVHTIDDGDTTPERRILTAIAHLDERTKQALASMIESMASMLLNRSAEGAGSRPARHAGSPSPHAHKGSAGPGAPGPSTPIQPKREAR